MATPVPTLAQSVARGPSNPGLLAALEAEIQVLKGLPIPELPPALFAEFFESGRRLGYEGAYFGRRRRLSTLAALLLAGSQDDLVPLLVEVVEAVLDEATWALPAHVGSPDPGESRTHLDLFACETAATLAEVAALLGSRLPPLLGGRIDDELESRVFRPFLERSEPWGWETSTSNWAAVCGGSLGLAALNRLGGPRLEAVLDRCRRACASFLRGYGDDGCCIEGLDYWAYGFGYYTFFAAELAARTGDSSLLDAPKVAAIASFPGACLLSGGRAINFSDASDEFRYPPGLWEFWRTRGAALPQPDPATAQGWEDPCGRFQVLVRNLFWAGEPGPVVALEPGVTWFPSAQWWICRGRGDWTVAAKGGHNDEHHNHNDLGHFIVHGRGRPWLVDLGAGEYTRDYFGDGRYEYLVTRSEGHSVPIVGGRGQWAGPHAVTGVTVGNEGAVRWFSCDLAPAYPPECGLASLVRRVEFDTDQLVVRLRDAFRWTSEPQTVVERIVTAEPLDTSLLRWTGGRAEALLGSQAYRDHGGLPRTAHWVDFQLEGSEVFVLELHLKNWE